MNWAITPFNFSFAYLILTCFAIAAPIPISVVRIPSRTDTRFFGGAIFSYNSMSVTDATTMIDFATAIVEMHPTALLGSFMKYVLLYLLI